MLAEYQQLLGLSDSAKIELIGILWDDLSGGDKHFALSDSLKQELQRRLEHVERDPASTLSEEELWQRVDRRRG